MTRRGDSCCTSHHSNVTLRSLFSLHWHLCPQRIWWRSRVVVIHTLIELVLSVSIGRWCFSPSFAGWCRNSLPSSSVHWRCTGCTWCTLRPMSDSRWWSFHICTGCLSMCDPFSSPSSTSSSCRAQASVFGWSGFVVPTNAWITNKTSLLPTLWYTMLCFHLINFGLEVLSIDIVWFKQYLCWCDFDSVGGKSTDTAYFNISLLVANYNSF
jgi:hypothetical protein